jgi:hypothetical protein
VQRDAAAVLLLQLLGVGLWPQPPVRVAGHLLLLLLLLLQQQRGVLQVVGEAGASVRPPRVER